MQAFWKRLRLTLDMIKFEHSIFALPFALTGALLAWRDAHFQIPDLAIRFVWIVVAMVGARSAAMAFNRILDADIDARNRRTASRHLPGRLAVTEICVGLYDYFVACVSLGRPRTESLCFCSRRWCFRSCFSTRFASVSRPFPTLCSAFVLAWLRPERGSPCEDPSILGSCGSPLP